MSKVRLECFLWGLGTAIGELPPYFMARAARLSGTIYDDEDVFEEKSNNSDDDSSSGLVARGKKLIEKTVEKVGFFAILACASVSV